MVKLGKSSFSGVSESAGAPVSDDSWWISMVELERQRAMEGEVEEGEREKERIAGVSSAGL